MRSLRVLALILLIIAAAGCAAPSRRPVTGESGALATPPRPEQPGPPPSYRSENVTYRSGDITVAGTLTLPSGAGPHPAVILVNGGGNNDRNETAPGHEPFPVPADALTRAGYAVLRTDERGTGGTGGILADADYQDLSGDIVAGLHFLRSDREIAPDEIGLLGHGEGGYLAPLVAAQPPNRIAFVIMMAGPAASGQDVLLAQNWARLAQEHAPAAEVADRIGFIDTLTTLLRHDDPDQARQYVSEHNASLPPERRQPESTVDKYVSTHFTAFVNYDPAAALHSLRMPVLALYGSEDLRVPADQNAPLARTLLSSDPDADVHVFDGLGHLMQPANTASPGDDARAPATIAPEVLDYVTGWLAQRVPSVR